jgi:hypothetical protein
MELRLDLGERDAATAGQIWSTLPVNASGVRWDWKRNSRFPSGMTTRKTNAMDGNDSIV